ncbi:allene oxide cyclase barrel-like domain-containing protein [Streptomyces sp. NPDC054783]
MGKIIFRPLILVGVAAAAFNGVPSASADTGSAHGAYQHAETTELVARQTQSRLVDVGSKGHSLGDQLVIAEDLYQNGKKIGDHAVVCSYVHIRPDELQCLGTFALPQGQITGQALLHLPSNSAVDVSLTGGSGAYSGAGGYVHTVPAGTTERALTFHVTR